MESKVIGTVTSTATSAATDATAGGATGTTGGPTPGAQGVPLMFGAVPTHLLDTGEDAARDTAKSTAAGLANTGWPTRLGSSAMTDTSREQNEGTGGDAVGADAGARPDKKAG